MDGCFGRGNVPSDSVNSVIFPYQLSDCWRIESDIFLELVN